MDLHCLQRQGISGFSRTRVKKAPKGEPELLFKEGACLIQVIHLFDLKDLKIWTPDRDDCLI